MHAIAAEMLGQDYVFMVTHWSIRHQSVDQSDQALDLHVDGSFLGSDHQALNFWVTLDDVGREAPGLTFLNDPDMADHIWKRFRDQQKAKSGQMIDPNILSGHLHRDLGAQLEESLVTPRIKGGEALLFDNSTLHATQDMSASTRDRVSIEFRVCGRSRIPASYRDRQRPIAVIEERDGLFRFRIDEAPKLDV